MFSSFQHSSEVSFQIPSILHHQQDLHNLKLTSSTAALHRPKQPSDDHKLVPSPRKPGRKRPHNNLQQQDGQRLAVDYDDDNEKKKKKMEHREIERKRRQEMANLCSSLRSLLPLDFIKGKRSMSEHMNQAINYVKHLEENLKGLKKTRDEIKKSYPRVTDSSSVHPNKNTESESSSRDPPITITVECSHGVIEVLVTSNCIGFPISRVMKALVQEGLNVISCNSTKVNERLIHSIHSEVSDEASIQVSLLQKKLVELVVS